MDCEKIVISTDSCEKSLYYIARAAMNVDKIELHFVKKYAPTAEYLTRMLRKAFGWLETDRGTTEVTNTKCLYNNQGICTNPKKDPKIKCAEIIRKNCEQYKPKYENTFFVETITLEKAGGIRGMD
jgi:hypothetical protein